MVDSTSDAGAEHVESYVLNQVQGRTESQKSGSKEENASGGHENHSENKWRSLFGFDRIDIFLKLIYVSISIPWLISIISFSIFDTKCIVFEQASVINCTQDFLTSNPRYWVFAWLLMSIISSFLLFCIVQLNHTKLNYQTEKAKKIFKKSCFASLIFLLVFSLVYYVIRIYTTRSEKTSLSISILVFMWPPVTVLLICYLNYLPRVHWTKTSCLHFTLVWLKECLRKNSNFIIYWLALAVYFVEITCKVASIMFDVALEVAPLLQTNFQNESNKLRGMIVMVIGFRLAFHLRLLSFFWQKLFHGEKDLFSEPTSNLIDEPLGQKQLHDEPGKNAQLEEITVA